MHKFLMSDVLQKKRQKNGNRVTLQVVFSNILRSPKKALKNRRLKNSILNHLVAAAFIFPQNGPSLRKNFLALINVPTKSLILSD